MAGDTQEPRGTRDDVETVNVLVVNWEIFVSTGIIAERRTNPRYQINKVRNTIQAKFGKLLRRVEFKKFYN